MVTPLPGSIYAVGLLLQDRYRLDEPLASGGMAEVWRGHDLVLQRAVAIKLLHPHLATDEVVVERFRREAISAAKLNHPHIIPTYDAGTDDGATYIVLGLVLGPSLAEVMRARGVSEREAVAITRQVTDALDYAHRSGLIHRDIKPANILLIEEDRRAMVGDFGIAKAIAEAGSDSLTMPGFVVGTPAYVAPEVLTGGEPTASTDIYATGVLLHELLCGHDPTEQPTQLAASAAAAPASRCTQLTGALAEIVATATHEQPERRFASAAAFRNALESYERTFEPRRTAPTQGASPRPQVPNEPTQVGIPTHEPPTSQHPATPLPPRPLRRPLGARRSAISLVLVLLLVLGAVVVGRLLGDLGGGRAATTTTTQGRISIPITSARSFDPMGDGAENEDAVTKAFDGNNATAWSTSTYSSRKFGNLKPGVGLVLTVDGAHALDDLQVDSPSSGWAASVYTSTGTPPSLDGWGQPVSSATSTPGSTHFDLHGATSTHLLLWITDLGAVNKVSISELHITGRPR